MIRPIRTMTISEISERKDDLLVSADDIKEMAKNVRNDSIDEFTERITLPILTEKDISRIIDEMKEGGSHFLHHISRKESSYDRLQ